MLILAGYTLKYRNALVLSIIAISAITLTQANVPVSERVAIIRAASGVLSGLLTLALVKYMELSRANKELWEKAQLASALDHADEAIISIDERGDIFSWNKAAEGLYGWSKEEALGENISIVNVDDGSPTTGDLLKKMKKGEVIQPFTATRKRKDNVLIPVYVAFKPIYSYGNKGLIGAAKIVRPIKNNYEAK